MTERLLWLVRAAAYGLVGYLTVGLAWPQVVGFAAGGVLILVWARFGPSVYVLGALAVVSGLLSPFPGSVLIALTVVAMLEAGSALTFVRSAVVFGVAVVAVEVGAVLADASIGEVLGYPLLLVAVLLAGYNRRSWRIRAEQAHEVAALAERARIAREIHDVLAHSLGALGIQLQAARAVLTDSQDVAKALDLLAKAQSMATAGLSETRRAIHALRSDVPPLAESLRDLASRHPAPVGLALDPVDVEPDSAVALVRVAQEALVNAAKHAGNQPVSVTLREVPDGVQLVVRNPLGTAGSLSTVDGGYGLAGMRERLSLREGTLTAGPVDGHWVVTARVPR
ncbi:histidine kinase [Kibdelosporangium lantanae]